MILMNGHADVGILASEKITAGTHMKWLYYRQWQQVSALLIRLVTILLKICGKMLLSKVFIADEGKQPLPIPPVCSPAPESLATSSRNWLIKHIFIVILTILKWQNGMSFSTVRRNLVKGCSSWRFLNQQHIQNKQNVSFIFIQQPQVTSNSKMWNSGFLFFTQIQVTLNQYQFLQPISGVTFCIFPQLLFKF